MKLSLAIPSFEDSSSINDLEISLKQIASWGYNAVEPLICCPAGIDVVNIKNILTRCGLKLSGFRTGLVYTREGLSFTDPDPWIRKQAIQRILEILKLTADFPGAMLMNGLVQGPLQDGVNLKPAQDWIVLALRKCCTRAERLKFVFCLEPVNHYELNYNNTIEDVAGLVDRVGSEYLKILIDTFHMNIEEADMSKSISKYSRYIGAVHIADSNRMAPGSGHLNYKEILKTLKEIGYSGYLTVEMRPMPDIDHAAKKAVTYLKEIIIMR